MSWLSENPWPLAGTLGLLAIIFLIALKTTQQGRYLLWALMALGLCLAVILVERFWVTDRERIEAVVRDLGRAVKRSDADAVLAYMTPDVSLIQRGETISGPGVGRVVEEITGSEPGALNPSRAIIRSTVSSTRFEFLSISRLKAHAGQQTRMGQANFRVHAAGSYGSINFSTPASGTDWSLGFREVDGRWMIENITATRLPANFGFPIR